VGEILFAEPKPTDYYGFNWWAAHIMNKCQIGGIRFGNIWYKNPWHLPNYDQMINRIIPSDPELMDLFCQSKLRVEVFILAMFNKWKAIEHLATKEASDEQKD